MKALAFVLGALFLLLILFGVHNRKAAEPVEKLPESQGSAHGRPEDGVSIREDLPLLPTPGRGGPDAEPPSGEPAEPAAPLSVYDIAFGEESYGPLAKVQEAFRDEPRNEAWASAMESGIEGSLDQSEATSWATVEHIECRTTICVVLGSMPDTLNGPNRDIYALLGNDFGLGWWPGANVVSRQHTYEEEGITRFALLIAEPARILELASPPD